MNQILHIFRKDARHLWPQISIVLVLFSIHAIYDVKVILPYFDPEANRSSAIVQITKLLLPLSIWFLIAMAVLQEALPGDREFWLTRPYHRGKLLAAKFLFILVFINLPLFLSDCYILGIQGFLTPSTLPDLFLRQVPVTTIFILPSFAIAAIINNVAQFVLAWTILIVTFLLQQIALAFLERGRGVIAFSISVVESLGFFVIVIFVILYWQYFKRETAKARLLFLCSALFAIPTLPFISRMAPWRHHPVSHVDKSDIRITYDLARWRSPRSKVPSPGMEIIRLPVEIDGLPPKTLLRGSGILTFNVGGKPWPEPSWQTNGTIEWDIEKYWQEFSLPSSVRSLKQPVRIQSSFNFEIVKNEVKFRAPIEVSPFVVPGVGRCVSYHSESQSYLKCQSGLGRVGETEVLLKSRSLFTIPSMRLLPWGLSPVSVVGATSFQGIQPGAQYDFVPHEPVASFSRTLDLPNVQLSDFIIR